MTDLEHAIAGLRRALDSPSRQDRSRRLLRTRIAGVKAALGRAHARGGNSWLAPREQVLLRERDVLLGRLSALGRQVLDSSDVEPLRRQLARLLGDLEHHRQRLNDLAYDTVALELGGSE